MGIFSDHIQNHAKKAGEHVSNAYKAAGGVRGFSEHAKKYASGLGEDYQKLHGNMPGVKEYVTSDAGRATARAAAGGAFHRYLETKAKNMARKGTVGGMVGNALFSFAHMALQTHMTNLKNDQRIFENVAKVHRQDPELQQMTHQHLREVVDNAHKYGGSHAEGILKLAQGELDRRQVRKNEEWDKGEAHRDGLRMARRQDMKAKERELDKGHREEAHKEKLQRISELTTASGHTMAAKLAHQKAIEKTKTEGVKKRQGAVQSTVKAQKDLIITKRTKGGGYDQAGEYHSNKEIAQRRANKAKKAAAPKRKRAV